MTHAAIVGGSSPGSTSSLAIWLVSTDMAEAYARLRTSRRRLTQNSVSRITVGIDERRRRRRAGSRCLAVDVVHQPAEVLAEEAGHDGVDDEERAADRQPRGDRVEPVGVGVEVGLRERDQVLGLALELARDLDQVVADVAQVGLRALARGPRGRGSPRARVWNWSRWAAASRCSSRTSLLEPVAAASGARAAGRRRTSASSASISSSSASITG